MKTKTSRRRLKKGVKFILRLLLFPIVFPCRIVSTIFRWTYGIKSK